MPIRPPQSTILARFDGVSSFPMALSTCQSPAGAESHNARATEAGIVLVNWNSWPDTLESLEAIFRQEGFSGPVVVCDNASSDDSVAYIQAWAENRLCSLPETRNPEVRSLIVPPVSKAFFSARFLSEQELETIGACDLGAQRLWVIRCGSNRGYAAGNNLGIKLLQRRHDINWFWLLNNDSVPTASAYRCLMDAIGDMSQPVIAGCSLLEYSYPSRVQACGATFNPYLFSATHNLQGLPVSELDQQDTLLAVSYPVGASMVVNRQFIDTVGLMCEDYFLYFEEIDWVVRHAWPSKAFIVTSSRVYHKGGATTEAGSGFRSRSLRADYFFIRSRLLFARKLGLFKWASAMLVTAIALLRRVLLFRKASLKNAFRATLDGATGRRSPKIRKRPNFKQDSDCDSR